MGECGSFSLVKSLGNWVLAVKFGNCHVLDFVSSSKELPADRAELINAIVNGINFYFCSSYVSMGLGQTKVKSLPCNILDISEFETVTTEPTTVTAADCILVECYHKKENSASTFFSKVQISMLFVGSCFSPLVLEEALMTDIDVFWVTW